MSSFTTEMMGRAKNPHLNCENEQQRNEVLSVTDQLMSQTNTSQLNRDGLPNKVSSITEKWTGPAKTLVVNHDNKEIRNKEFSDTDKGPKQAKLSPLHCDNKKRCVEVSSFTKKLMDPTKTAQINCDSDGRRNACHNEQGGDNRENIRLTVQLQDNIFAYLRSDEINSNVVNDNCHVVSETYISCSMLEIEAEIEMKRTSNTRVQQLINHMKTERISCNQGIKKIQCTLKSEILTKKPHFTFDAWEFRAFITSIIVAVTTIL